MKPALLDAILAKIDEAVGPPESESAAQHAARVLMLKRHADARAIRKAAGAV